MKSVVVSLLALVLSEAALSEAVLSEAVLSEAVLSEAALVIDVSPGFLGAAQCATTGR